ncbi:MAG: hypothetical protein COX80_01050 [Candidatus Magasanikbacteria bacterium CG_4_10_14_0_2_um_filter_33_14]|uniref:HTH cro/C1-type domain-containing protein n=1 Tax=Candidatus Magasanikbacteria bacterium CG_4_10_14_0_2_um_filter_33_14 TaxID=1974636 RepID=A0A2M7VBL4_9BACT|nr:MAG: hypothetical protein COX80_01050 [Candidatus Magasanikbacteria bacterium CG_4_10_14_0_2_um_filter_33_14]
MYSFYQLIKKIREESGLTQEEFAKSLGVSKVLISMVETGQKKVSKSFIIKLAKLLNVHPASITPFLHIYSSKELNKISPIEKKLVLWGEEMQKILIKKRAKKIKKYVK